MKGSFFNKLGLADMEKVHSSIIGWMFSDDCEAFKKSVKSELLCKLFKEEKKNFVIIQSDIETHNIDILITTKDENGNNECWVVENKIKSSQHDNQLDKYVEILDGKEYKKDKCWKKYESYTMHFCFLTLIGEDPEGKYADKWKNVLYSEFLLFLRETFQKGENNTHQNFLEEYAYCVEMMTSSMTDFIGNPSNYAFVFEKKAKDEKDYDEIEKLGENALYIAKNGLETIFQKCFLKNWIKELALNPIVLKTMYMEEWRTNATFAVIPSSNYNTIDNCFKLQVEFQDGSFKVVLISINDDIYKSADQKVRLLIENYIPIFKDVAKKNKWNFQDSKKSKNGKKPRISITKKMNENWFGDIDGFKNGYKDAVEIAQKVFEQIKQNL